MSRVFTMEDTFSRDSRKSSPRTWSFSESGPPCRELISGIAALHSGHHVAQKTRRTGFFPKYWLSDTG
jgi:hypothetical protein